LRQRITLPPDAEAVLCQLIDTPEASAALARLFLAGAVICDTADESVFPCAIRDAAL
jgi:hypothetical protein